MNMIVLAMLSVTVIGTVLATILCIASKVMAVEVDERVAKMLECLPGSNCGACGYPGCEGYAVALAGGTGIKTNLCPPGGPAVIEQLSEILGVTAEVADRQVAVVHCMGDSAAVQQKMEYQGIQTCAGEKQLFGGAGACAFGCLGYADCQVVCPNDAICMEDGLARINANRCISCALCVKACPNSLITMQRDAIPVLVMCSNIEKGAVVRKKCTYGCIACTKCVKECPEKAIVIEDNLARINYEACNGCGKCVEVCMTKCIQPFGKGPVVTKPVEEKETEEAPLVHQ